MQKKVKYTLLSQKHQITTNDFPYFLKNFKKYEKTYSQIEKTLL